MAATGASAASSGQPGRDAVLVLLSKTVRSLAYGCVAVILAIYLKQVGLEESAIGLILSAASAGGAVVTIGISGVADRIGRRRALAISGVVMAGSALIFAFTSDLRLLVIASFVGTVSNTGTELGPFTPIEQALLPQTAANRYRNQLFATYGALGSLAGSIGALGAGLPAYFVSAWGLDPISAYRPVFFGTAALALVATGLALALSPAVELGQTPARPSLLGVRRSRGVVARLSLLFAVDSFGGGFIPRTFIAYWFYTRFDASLETIGLVFAVSGIMQTLSYWAAAWLADRIGLVNTIVYTQAPSHLCLVLMAVMPTFPLAVALFLVRQALSEMDVPARQAYTVAVVDPEERTAASALTNVSRMFASSVSPAFAGFLLQYVALSVPYFVAAGLKIGYNVALWQSFRKLRPNED